MEGIRAAAELFRDPAGEKTMADERMFNAEAFAFEVMTKLGARTYKDAAEEAGVDHTMLHRCVKGKRLPNAEMLGKVCAWLGKDVGVFFRFPYESVCPTCHGGGVVRIPEGERE